MPELELWVIITLAVVGLMAGTLGGMLGVGGSVIMIPAMAMVFGQTEQFNQHLYQAAAMIVNVCVVVPAAVSHYRAGAVVSAALVRMIPTALVMILVGVWISDLPVFEGGPDNVQGPIMLGRVLAVFLLYVIAVNIRRLFHKPRDPSGPVDCTFVTWPRATAAATVIGVVAGLTGVGGGGIAVPLQQMLMKLRLRNCIATSAALICVTAGFGALYKNFTLAEHHLDYRNSLMIAALLAPTAFIGGFLGARLTHVLPIRVVRVVFILLMIVAAYKMAAIQ